MHPELVKTAIESARSAFGNVGLVAVTPIEDAAWRLVLITDAGPRTVVVTADDPPSIVLEETSPLIQE